MRTVSAVRARGYARSEEGFALVMALVLLLVGSLVMIPVLSFMATGTMAGGVYRDKMHELYAADSGIEDAKWLIGYGHMTDAFLDYSQFDFATAYDYELTQEVNGLDVDVNIRNVWIPMGLAEPTPPSVAEEIIGGVGGNPPTLIVTGSVPTESTFQIKIQYYPVPGEELDIVTLGVWLPLGFTYDTSVDSNFEDYYSSRDLAPHAGGQAVVWSFDSYPFSGTTGPFGEAPFPGVNPASVPMVSTLTFHFQGPAGRNPQAVTWIDTNLDLLGSGGPTYTWDADTRVFRIDSTAGGTMVESYVAKSEIRHLSGAVSGDYYATGNSLIGGNRLPPANYHNELRNYTSATVSTSSDPANGIPEGATVEAAYLYWTGWMDWNHFAGEATRRPNGDISRSGDWDKTTDMYSYVDEEEADGDDSFLRHGTTNGHALFSFEPFSLPASAQVLDVTVSLVAEDARNGVNKMQPALRIAGADYLTQSTSTEVPNDYGAISYAYTTNPATLAAWTVDDVNGIGTYALQGFGVYSADATPRIRLTQVYITVHCANTLRYPDDPTAENLATLVEDTARVNRVLFNDTAVDADTYQVLCPPAFAGTVFEDTWFYAARTDVTELLWQWIEDGIIEGNGAGDYNFGHYYVGTSPTADNYRVNQLDSDYSFSFYTGGGSTGYPLGTPSPYDPPNTRYTAAHAGWSLLIIYASAETLGHQLFLYDIAPDSNFDFFFGWRNNADFDNDGAPGGRVSGFLVPNPIPGETLAGRITVFVGEGDAGYTEDYFRVNGSNMSNSASPANNVWNSNSPGLSVPGVDIDHFEITWASGILEPADTSVQIDIPTGTVSPNTDGFTMVYMILSFRSDTTTGGALGYLIH